MALAAPRVCSTSKNKRRESSEHNYFKSIQAYVSPRREANPNFLAVCEIEEQSTIRQGVGYSSQVMSAWMDTIK